MRFVSRSRLVTAGCAVAALGVVASADGVITTIPHDDRWGDTVRGGPLGAVTPLTPTSFVACMQGPDNTSSTSDDLTLLVTDLDGTPTATSLQTPYLSDWGPWISVMCATRCLVPAMGPDGDWNTDDDVVYVLDRLGSHDDVVPITIGHLSAGDGHRPIPLDTGTFAITTYGADGDESTADDKVAIVSGVGTTNTVTYLDAPNVAGNGQMRPVALSPTSFLVMSWGEDGDYGTEDDAVYLFTDVGRTNRRVSISTPYAFEYGASTPVRVTPTRALVCSVGPDRDDMTADDLVYVLDRLGTKNDRRTIPVPSIGRYGAGVPVVIDANTVVITSLGADGESNTADDAIVLLRNIASRKPKTTVYGVGFLDDDAGSRAVRIDARSIAVNTGGPDGTLRNGDDRIALIENLGKGPVMWTFLPMGGLSPGHEGRAVPLSEDSFVIGDGGPDGVLDSGGDDRVTLVTDVFGTPQFQHYAVNGERTVWRTAGTPRILGDGRVAFASSGSDDTYGTGQDDVFQVVPGLPTANRLDVSRMDILFDAAAPQDPARISVRGDLHIEGVIPSTSCDVTVTVGNAAQTIRSTSLHRSGVVYTYSDPRGRNGFVTKLVVNSRSGAFKLSGKGVGTGVESTSREYVPVAVSYGDVQVSDVCVATSDDAGLHYRR